MREPERELRAIGFVIDTNCINARQKMPEMNRLEGWAADGLFQPLLTSDVAQQEALAGRDAVRREKAYRFLFIRSEITTGEEKSFLEAVERCLFPHGAKTQNHRNDVEIVFTAGKYGRQLITTDGASKSQPGGILGNRDKLARLGIKVLTPKDAVSTVELEIAARDQHTREFSRRSGEPLPDWVGTD